MKRIVRSFVSGRVNIITVLVIATTIGLLALSVRTRAQRQDGSGGGNVQINWQELGLAVPPESRVSGRDLVLGKSTIKVAGGRTPTTREQAELNAILDTSKNIPGDLVSRIETYLRDSPDSPYRLDLKSRLAAYYKKTGRYSRSFDHYTEVWESLRGVSEDSESRVMADMALAQATYFLASFGKYEAAKASIEENKDRSFTRMETAYWWDRAREKLTIQELMPQSAYRCGIYAVKSVGKAMGVEFDAEKFFEERGRREGLSLGELVELSRKYGINLKAVIDREHLEIPVPSVVHMVTEHYAAITERNPNGTYVVYDPTNGGTRWLTPEEINEEASGYFLIPEDDVTREWRQVTDLEAVSVVGRGSACPPDDYFDGGPDTCMVGNCAPCSSGMAQWSVSEPHINLWLEDTPLQYRPSKGPWVTLNLKHRQRNPFYSNLHMTSFGNGWLSSFLSTVFPDTTITNQYHIYYPGGLKSYLVKMGQEGLFKREVLSGIFSGSNLVGYQIDFPDGSKMKYEHPDPSVTDGFYLTEIIDPQGDALVFDYDSADRLDSITDADGEITDFSYFGPSDGRVDKVTVPDGRFAEFEYDSGDPVFLESITDAAGIVSSFTYDVSSRIDSLTTPYGTTHFDYWDGTGYNYSRWLKVTTPENKVHGYYYLDDNAPSMPSTFSSSVIPVDTAQADLPSHTFSVSNRNDRNSFYWDPKQWNSLAETNFLSMDWDEFKKARITQWLLLDDHAIWFKNHVQNPSADGSTEGQITFYDYQGKSLFFRSEVNTNVINKVSQVARKNPDGELWFNYTSYNDKAKPVSNQSTYSTASSYSVRTNTLAYYSGGINLKSRTDYNGNVVEEWAYDGSSRPIRHIVRPSAIVSYTNTYAYNSSGYLTNETSHAGLVKTYQYYSSGASEGRLEKLTLSHGLTKVSTNSFEWYSDGMLKKHTSPRGFVIINNYDELGRLVSAEYSGGTTNIFAYTNSSGTGLLEKTYMVDRAGNKHYWQYNGDRQLTNYTNPLTNSWSYGYCDCGALDSVTDAAGKTTNFDFDFRGLRTMISYPGAGGSGGTEEFEYDLLGRNIKQTVPLGDIDYNYNNQGLLVLRQNDAGEDIEKLFYDINDNLKEKTDSNAVKLTMTYDLIGRITKVTYPGGAYDEYKYSSLGVTNFTDRLGKITTTEYDPIGRVVKVKNPNNEEIEYTYAPDGKIETMTDGRGKTTTWGYDIEGRVTSKKYHGETYPSVTYDYFPDGNLKYRRYYTSSSTYEETLYEWDSAGNLTKINYPSGTADIDYQYDANNRMKRMDDGIGVTLYSYTDSGQLKTENGPFANDTVEYAYNTSRLREQMDVEQSGTTEWQQTYSYDPNRRLSQIIASRVSANPFEYTYPTTGSGHLDPASYVWEKLEFPSGTKIERDFDSNARLEKTELKNSLNTVLNSHSYTYTTRDEVDIQTLYGGKTVDYDYDDYGQLLEADYSVGDDYEYTYDAGWNLDVRKVNGVTNLDVTVNDKNIIVHTTTGGWASHDSKGNHTVLEGVNYYYNAENQLYWIQDYGNNIGYEFKYDGKLRKRKQIKYTWNGSSWVWNSEKWYIYDGMNVVQERNSSNVPEVHYTRGNDLSGNLSGAGGIGGLLARSAGYSTSGGSWSQHDYYHGDLTGNVTYMASSGTTPTLRAKYEYDPFGRIQTQSGALASTNTQRFSSKEQIGSSPLCYYGYRFYHADAQRWMNRDPIEESGGLNLYGFVVNRPLDKIDPYGLDVYHMVFYDAPVDHLPGFNHEVILVGNFTDGFVLFEPENSFSGEDARWINNGRAPTTCRTARFPINSWPFRQIPVLTWHSENPDVSIDLRFPTGGIMGAGGLVGANPFLGPGFGFSDHFISSTPEQDEWIIDYFTNEDRGPVGPYWGHCFFNCGMWADHFMETTRSMMPLNK